MTNTTKSYSERKMTEEKTREQMLEALDIMLDEALPYGQRLEAYEYLLEDCGEIVDEMLGRSYSLDGDKIGRAHV